ncbi:MAG: FHA domain-containing protein [Micrococcales bacterium]|nr:FHA domain-containing protein [Micrococcales bacterium]NBR60315.1 FHA domain-containing protein [Actinomycetota bacterium]NBR54379.1 FHA domain-containing protein [Micrococcales bacterium]NBT46214.1 FHA domain-containing protein [Actinomycetota bacterium]NBY43486.1 FHA domain-containing protein [Micrococcales bacterium]
MLGAEVDQLSPEEQAAVAALPQGNALLIVRKGPNKGSRFLLDSDVITVGRHPNADVFLDDVTVSRRHAEIKRVDGNFVVTDLASLNGTYYEGARVEVQELANESELQVGKYHFTFYSSKRDSQ